MSVTNGYCTEVDFRAAIGSTSSLNQPRVEACIQAASRRVDEICGRRFYADTNASARVFAPDTSKCCETQDFHTTTGLVVKLDTGGDGTYATTLTINTDFLLLPRNAVDAAGMTWPYTGFRLTGTYTFANWTYWEPAQVTAKWGWASVPDAVEQATLLLAKDLYKQQESMPGGIIGVDGWGPVRTREDPAVWNLLAPFRQTLITVA